MGAQDEQNSNSREKKMKSFTVIRCNVYITVEYVYKERCMTCYEEYMFVI